MREGLSIEKLKSIYGSIAGHYDIEHAIITAKADQRGRKLLVEHSVTSGDNILDCGAGTGTTGILAAKKTGNSGKVTMFDLSEDMLSVAREKAEAAGLQNVSFQTGDMVHLPFEGDQFDVVLSTYSLCPLYDPAKGALEMYRVTKPGGKIAIAHSTEPDNPFMKWLADKVENIAWKFSWLSMGCRTVTVLPALEDSGAKVIYLKKIGVPLWPFIVFVLEKPTEK